MLTLMMMTEEEIRSRNDKVEALIEQMSNGELSAMGELYKLIETDIFSYALSRTANKADAEDITQDTFVQVWKNATQYRPIGKPLAWIFTIEKNLIRRQFNRNRRLVSLDELMDTEDGDGDFSESVINSELICQLLAFLSEEEREIISLHIVSGLKHREIARFLEKPLSTVLSKYNRAIKKLRLQVKEKGEG